MVLRSSSVKNELFNDRSHSPKILIITPTTELASQLSKVVKTISSVLRFKSACLTSIHNIDEDVRKASRFDKSIQSGSSI